MKDYTFSVTLLATITVEAESISEARRIVRPICEGGQIVVTETADNQESISGTCDVEGELELISAE